MKALVIGYEEYLSWFMPALLHRAGFTVDIITRMDIFKSSRYVRSLFKIPPNGLAVTMLLNVLSTKNEQYDWIIITEDDILQEVLAANIPVTLKLKILPVIAENHFAHLYSKVRLSELLSKSGILTPAYRIARKVKEAIAAAEEIGYPVIVKVDSSNGGIGVHECHDANDIKKLIFLFTGADVLIQKKIIGEELDLSAIYYKGELIHFNYAFFRRVAKKFGPSTMRDYHAPETVDSEVYFELQQLGKALGAHGFTNITCIYTQDKKRFYIEADMRPNAWIDLSRFIGNDPAEKIRAAFFKGSLLKAPVVKKNPIQAEATVIPHFMTMTFFELLRNRDHVWKYIPYDDAGIIHAFLRKKAFFQMKYIWNTLNAKAYAIYKAMTIQR